MYKQTKYEGNMTETSSKGVLRLTTTMFLFVGLVGIWIGGCEEEETPKTSHSNLKIPGIRVTDEII